MHNSNHHILNEINVNNYLWIVEMWHHTMTIKWKWYYTMTLPDAFGVYEERWHS